jgi:hypothetical protein
VAQDVVGAHSASELLRLGVPRRQVISCLTDELDLTEDEAELAISVADTPMQGLEAVRRPRRKLRRRDGDGEIDLRE